MRRALVLIDLQHAFLDTPDLEPHASQVVAGALAALGRARAHGDLIVFVRTSVSRAHDRRMAHWREAGVWRCEVGTAGHAFAPGIEPRPGEHVVDKATFSPFVDTTIDALLREAAIDAIAIAGVHLHACVRQTALDAYQRGYATTILDDAVGSDDPLHAAVTRRYLERRGIRFEPGHAAAELAAAELALAALTSEKPRWAARDPQARAAQLDAWAVRLEHHQDTLVEAIVASLGKPIALARGEVARAAALARAAAGQVRAHPVTRPAGATSRVIDRPLGCVLALTPYNNPVAIPIGKLAPALGFGNVVLWKPAPLGHAVAEVLHALSTDLFDGALALVAGGSRQARELMADPRIDAVTLSGASASGHAAAEICARRRIPLQAELGGNNAAIVWHDADLPRAAAVIAEGAFGFAGQRCTANRRVVVDARVHDRFVALLVAATAALPVGDPKDPRTLVGPLVTAEHAARVHAVLARASAEGAEVLRPHGELAYGPAWVSPAIVLGAEPRSEIVSEETFGPVLVVQRASDWEEALALVDGVRQGLVAALFTPDPDRRHDFLQHVRAGILKLDRSTADADAEAPFGGWKSSGLGPPEHGPGNAAFYLRSQAVYDGVD